MAAKHGRVGVRGTSVVSFPASLFPSAPSIYVPCHLKIIKLKKVNHTVMNAQGNFLFHSCMRIFHPSC